MSWYQDAATRPVCIVGSTFVRLSSAAETGRGEIASPPANIDGADQTYANGTSPAGKIRFRSLPSNSESRWGLAWRLLVHVFCSTRFPEWAAPFTPSRRR